MFPSFWFLFPYFPYEHAMFFRRAAGITNTPSCRRPSSVNGHCAVPRRVRSSPARRGPGPKVASRRAWCRKFSRNQLDDIPIGSMVLVYLLTWLGYIDGIHVTIYGIHGSYGIGCRSKWKTDVGPQMWISSWVLTIQLLGYLILTIPNWPFLFGDFNLPPLKNHGVQVSWDDDIPNWIGKIKNVPNHQPDLWWMMFDYNHHSPHTYLNYPKTTILKEQLTDTD